jgi:prefoldin subunit 5
MVAGDAMETMDALRKRLRELDEKIAETKKRLPAHSVKPPVMTALLELEDEYDALLEQVESLNKNST